jgi:hypothetical protein
MDDLRKARSEWVRWTKFVDVEPARHEVQVDSSVTLKVNTLRVMLTWLYGLPSMVGIGQHWSA